MTKLNWALLLTSVALGVVVAGCPDSRRIRLDDPPNDDGFVDVTEYRFDPVRRVDILFVVDNSGSMAEEQNVLAEQIVVMARELIAPEDEWAPVVGDLHIGVVSTDMGTGGYTIQTCSNPMSGDDGVLQNTRTLASPAECAELYSAPDCDGEECPWLSHSPMSPDDGTEHSNPPIWEDFGCVATLGTGGCGFEQHLEASYVALTVQTGPGMPNEGFLRDDSLLAIIYVTDEDDCSTGNTEFFDPSRDDYGSLNVRCSLYPDELYPIERYHDAFVDLRGGDLNRVVVAAITGVPIDGSWNPGDSIERLRELQQVNPENPVELLKSCDTSMGAAYPPVRIAELVYSFGTNGILESICRDDWTSALQAITRTIQGFVRTTCVPVDSPASLIERCRLVQTLPSDLPCPNPADVDGPERTQGWHVDMGLAEVDVHTGVELRRRCEILLADYDDDGCPDGASDCSARHFIDGLQGWFVDRNSRDCEQGELRLTTPSISDLLNDIALECRKER